MDRIPHLFWIPCAAHCLDLLLEDIGKIKEFNTCINMATKVSRFIYKHGRIHNLMREKIGGDLVTPGATCFATSFLTLASMHRHKNGKEIYLSTRNGMRLGSPPLKKDNKLRKLPYLITTFGNMWKIVYGLHNTFWLL
jgi:hypothetical protein